MEESPPEESTPKAQDAAASPEPLNTGRSKRGRPPKPGGDRDIERKVEELRKLAALPIDEFRDEIRKHHQYLVCLTTEKVYKALNEDKMTPFNVIGLYQVLAKESGLAQQVPNIGHQTNIQINGVTRDTMRGMLGVGVGRQKLPSTTSGEHATGRVKTAETIDVAAVPSEPVSTSSSDKPSLDL